MAGERAPWPVPLASLGASKAASVVFRHRSAFHLAIVVKASFQWVQGGRAQPVDASSIERHDRTWDDDPARSPERTMDLAPFLPRAEIVVVGHAHAPAGLYVPASSARLGVFRDVALLEKTLHVYGDRPAAHLPPQPFQRMPLRWEHACGGPGTDNPVGAGARPGAAPNLIDPMAPTRPSSFAPMAAAWPGRSRRAGQLHGLAPPVFDFGDDFDFSYFQSAPEDQQVDALGGDEWLLLDGMHPSLPRLSTQLPGFHAEALVWCERGPSAGLRWSPPLALDTVFIDADRLRLDLVWRGSFTLPEGDAMLPDLRAAAGLDTGVPLVWPDVDAELEDLRSREAPMQRREASSLEATALHRQVTSVVLPAISDVLPFPDSTRGRVAGPATTPLPATPWDAPRPALGSVTDDGDPLDGETPLPDAGVSLPFQRPPEPVVHEASDPEDVEATYDALATGSTVPPPMGEDLPPVELPPPPRAPVLVPPPAVGSGRVLGAFSLRYGEGSASVPPPPLADVPPAPPPLAPPPPLAAAPATPPPPASPSTPPEEASLSGAPATPPPALPGASAAEVRPHAPSPGPSPAAAAGGDDARSRVLARLRAGESLDGADLARMDLEGVDFAGASLVGANLAGATLRGCSFVGAKLAEAKLVGADLEGANLEGADCTRADLTRARLVGARAAGALLAHAVLQGIEATGADFSRIKGSRATFARARLANARFVEADLANVDFAAAVLDGVDATSAQVPDGVLDDAQAEGSVWSSARLVRVRGHGARMGKSTLTQADATASSWDRASFDEAVLDEAVLTDASLLRATLAAASLRRADLRGAKLSNATGEGANFAGAQLGGADLRQVRLDGAVFDGASLAKLVGTKASLEGAVLTGADLRGANLRTAKLREANLTGADLREADLRDADLQSARLEGTEREGLRLVGAKLEGATGVEPDATS